MSSISTQYFNSILQILESMGFQGEDHFAAINVSSSALENPKFRIDINQLKDLLDVASESLNEPNIGLELGYRFRVATFTDTGSILAHCNTLAEAAQMNAKYQRLVETLGVCEFVRQDNAAFLVWNESFTNHDTYRHLTELIVGGYVLTTNWLSWGFDGGSKCVRFKHKAPANTSRYFEVFQVPVEFQQTENHLEFDADYVDRQLPTANPEKMLYVSDRLDAVLSSFDQQSTLRADAVGAIHDAIRRSRLSIGEVADKLEMSERSLRRNLSHEGLTYRELVESVRQNMCKTYMADGRSLTEIAQILGYNDQSAFTRAFKNWYGVVPSEFKSDKFSF